MDNIGLARLGLEAKRTGMFELANIAMAILLFGLNEDELDGIELSYEATDRTLATVTSRKVPDQTSRKSDMVELRAPTSGSPIRLRARVLDLSEEAVALAVANGELRKRFYPKRFGQARENYARPELWAKLFQLVTREQARLASNWALSQHANERAWEACPIHGRRAVKRSTDLRRRTAVLG